LPWSIPWPHLFCTV